MILASSLESLFWVKISISLTSEEHGGFRDVDGVVPELAREPGRNSVPLGVDVALPVFMLFVLFLFIILILLKYSSIYFSSHLM